jgi:ABC-type transporter Mla MlaB component
VQSALCDLQPTRAPADGALALPSELSIYTAAELHPRWLLWLEALPPDGAPARLHGGAVDQVDAAGMQLLLSLARALALRGQALQLHEPSLVLQQACQALGLQAWLQACQPAPARPQPAGACA